jgi:hypothetical protein
MVNPEHKTVYKHVKQHHPKIHEEHFKRGHSSEFIKPKFANPYKLREVSAAGSVVREYMFSCLTRDCATKNIKQYFVSPEYDVRWSVNPVRFVFTDVAEKKRVVAVAEKMAGKRGNDHASPPTEQARKGPARPEETYEDSASAYKDDSESESESW